jgi:hypothetical protein
MNDLCLRFADEVEALAVLEAAGLTTEGMPAPGVWLDVIGVIVRPVGEPDAEGVQQTETLPGWHVNALLSGAVPEQLQPHIVTPAARVRVWAS